MSEELLSQDVKKYLSEYDLRLHDQITSLEEKFRMRMDDSSYSNNLGNVADMFRNARIEGEDVDEILLGGGYKVFSTFASGTFANELFRNSWLVQNIMFGTMQIGFINGLQNTAVIYEVQNIPQSVYDIIDVKET